MTLQAQIAAKLVDAARCAKSDLLGIIGSYGDTMSDEDVLAALRHWNYKHRVERLSNALEQGLSCAETFQMVMRFTGPLSPRAAEGLMF